MGATMLHRHVSTVAQNGQAALEISRFYGFWLRVLGRGGVLSQWMLPICDTYFVSSLCRSFTMSNVSYEMCHTLWLNTIRV